MAFDPSAQSALAQAMAAGNINIADDNMEVMDLSERSLEAQERQARAQLEIEVARRARTVAVPTNEEDVKLKLRELGHPICLFGERAGDRRDRLRKIVAQRLINREGDFSLDSERSAGSGGGQRAPKKAREEVSYYVPNTAEQLKAARASIAQFSFDRARKRLRQEQTTTEEGDAKRAVDVAAVKLVRTVKALMPSASQVGDARRPLSTCAFSRDGGAIATGSWSALVKIWGRDCSPKAVLRGHTERVCDVQFHPEYNSSSPSPGKIHLASGGADSLVQLWSMEKSEPIGTLTGHAARLGKVRFHPSGQYLASSSFDKTWRLWDLQTQQCIQLQEGHAKEVYALSMHVDGSLVATGDLGGIGRLWDLRSGKSILVLPGHVKQLLTMDFSPDGFHLATGSDDHTVRIWDLRKRETVYTLPAHQSLISTVKFAPVSGEYLTTSSFDGTIKTWSARDWTQLGEFSGHEGKISCIDVAWNERCVVSSSFDRTFKLWTSLDDAESDDDVTMAQ